MHLTGGYHCVDCRRVAGAPIVAWATRLQELPAYERWKPSP